MVVAGWYRGALASLVKGAKFSGDRTGLPRITNRLKSALTDGFYDAIVGVPSDHMLNECLCDELASHFQAERINAIKRKPRALRQVGLRRDQRRTNAGKSFILVERVPQSVLLVDDIVTTGATVDAISILLKEGGALIVDVVALARAPAGPPARKAKSNESCNQD